MVTAVMTDEQRMAELSHGFLAVLAAYAGYTYQRGPEPDMDSVDVTLRAGGLGRAAFDVQLKATRTPVWRGDGLHFRLGAKNYRDLRERRTVKAVLVVLVLPSDPDDWVELTPERLVLHGAAVWDWLEGAGEVPGGKTVVIPAGQTFDVASMREIARRVAQGLPLKGVLS